MSQTLRSLIACCRKQRIGTLGWRGKAKPQEPIDLRFISFAGQKRTSARSACIRACKLNDEYKADSGKTIGGVCALRARGRIVAINVASADQKRRHQWAGSFTLIAPIKRRVS